MSSEVTSKQAAARVRFYSVDDGAFRVERTEDFPTLEAAFLAARAHAVTAGFTGIKVIENESDPGWTYRVTGKKPGGRPGRNLAAVDDLRVDW